MSIERYGYIADAQADTYGIPRPIFKSLIENESSWNSRALGKAGDAGLTQLTPRIYKAYKADPYNPQQNLRAGANFLSDLYKKYGNWRDALSHYNAGFNLSAGRTYADKVLGGADRYKNDPRIKAIKEITNPSLTPVLDDLKAGKMPAGVSKPESDKSAVERGLDDFTEWASLKFASVGTAAILYIIAAFLAYLAITKLTMGK